MKPQRIRHYKDTYFGHGLMNKIGIAGLDSTVLPTQEVRGGWKYNRAKCLDKLTGTSISDQQYSKKFRTLKCSNYKIDLIF